MTDPAREAAPSPGDGDDLLASPELLAWLEAHHGTWTAARALWAWAGGDEAALAQADVSRPWPALWARATGDPGPGAGARALVREALHERPGEPLLLDWCHAVTCAREPEAAATADLLVAALARLAPFRCPPGPLRATLAAFPAGRADAAFAALAPALDEVLGPRARARLEDRLERLLALAGAAARLRGLRDELRALEEQGGETGGGALAANPAAAEVTRALAALLRGRAALDPDDRAAAALLAGVERVERRLAFRRAPSTKAALAALAAVLHDVGAAGDDPFEDAATAGAGLLAALRATTPDPEAEEPWEASPPDARDAGDGVTFDGAPATAPPDGVRVDHGRREVAGTPGPAQP